MSRRTGQAGHIEKREMVGCQMVDGCSGPGEEVAQTGENLPGFRFGCFSTSERERRAREIIAASGADTVEYFNKVVNQQKIRCCHVQEASKMLA